MFKQFTSMVFCLAASASTAMADVSTHAFNISIYGIPAGTMQVALAEENGNYIVDGIVRTTGLLSNVAKFDFTGRTIGAVSDGALVPSKYQIKLERKKYDTEVLMTFADKTPTVEYYRPERDHRAEDIDPSKQKGVVDLITATYVIVGDASAETLCNKRLQMFDGRRRSQIFQTEPKFKGNTAICHGAYQRIAGFSPDDLEDGATFPFTSYYEKTDTGLYRLMRVSTKSTVGSATLYRRK